MDISIAAGMIGVIRSEKTRRAESRQQIQHPDAAYDQWLFTDEPFVNELCLNVLAALRHQVERELVRLAARVTDDGGDLNGDAYRHRVNEERQAWRQDPRSAMQKLRLTSFPAWNSSMKTLQLLVNCYKHGPWQKPELGLLKHLNLDVNINYAPLPESRAFLEALAASMGLPADADYCDVAEKMLSLVKEFLTEVEQQPFIGRVNWPPVSLLPDDAEC